MRTPEEIQLDREERWARTKRLREAFASLSEPERKTLADSVVFTCDGHKISPVNTALVNFQKPGASVIGGYRQWKAHNRYVKKGEKCLSIWIPLGQQPNPDGTDFPSEDDENEIVRFRLQSVFDISQTEVLNQGK